MDAPRHQPSEQHVLTHTTDAVELSNSIRNKVRQLATRHGGSQWEASFAYAARVGVLNARIANSGSAAPLSEAEENAAAEASLQWKEQQFLPSNQRDLGKKPRQPTPSKRKRRSRKG